MTQTPIRNLPAIACFLLCWQVIFIVPLEGQSNADHHVRIGLALSGGGARGAAHIGVLKVLEREGIHIDCIASASFGSIVGGLYATGYSAEEIENLVTSNWQEVLSNQPERAKAPLVQGRSQRQLAHISLRGFNPTLPVGLLRGQKLMEIVNRYTVEQMLAAEYDFDRLPVRFRAVSTDLLTGRSYIFKSGRMSEAIRASCAIPLFFTPWPKDGMLLVDGSMSNNLPADIVREMGADIVIAVDVAAPDAKSEQIQNFLNVYEQCLGMIMKQTVESHYRYADILIKPDLNGYSNTSYSRMREIIQQGADAAEAHISDIRAHIGNSPVIDTADRRVEDNGRVIDSVSFKTNGGSHPEDHAPIHPAPKMTSKPSEAIHPEKLANDTQTLYASGLFENVDYELQHVEENRYHLQYQMLESPSNTLGLSLRYGTDYNLQGLAEFTSRGLFGTASTATISGRFGSAAYQNAALRLIHPRFPFVFLEPQVQWLKLERLRFKDHEDTAAFVDRRHAAQLALGTEWKGRFEASVGYRFEAASFLPQGLRNSDVAKTNLAGVRLQARRDTLDAQEFPRTGMLLDLQADKRVIGLGSDQAHSILRVSFDRYFSLSEKTTLGVRLVGMGSRGNLPEYEKAFLGGYGYSDSPSVRLVGFIRDEVNADRLALAGASIRREVFSRPMSFARRGFLTLEYNVARISGQESTPSDSRKVQGGAVGFSLDTMIGPVRFAVGVGDPGKTRAYITLGPSF